MAESAALLVDEVLLPVPIRQWVLSFTYQLRLPLAPAHESAQVAKQAGFSLHVGVMADSHLKELRERLCRYVSRSAVSEKRLALTSHGKVRYELKTPYRDVTTHVLFEPLDFIARLARRISRHFSSTKTPHRLPRCGSTEGSAAPIGHFLQGNR